ncbi:PQQ-dependent sugar dehydrogenase [Sphingobium sp. CAP-1]|uniref:PQQ-dependent sugar dehydrogenase n=1 Tax=Sphingobium sp. CAP-1 TaxID=2676077 RepID=UPI0012BB1EB9|nr:PQQ-dependent sugar dehydrogenase [Sphingobium sp. CAP-1]QGP79428.1 c-type cytochrome [Sphingobium sp. CAP-1]
MAWKMASAMFAIAMLTGVPQARERTEDGPAVAAQHFASQCAGCHMPNATDGQAPPLVNKALRHGPDMESLVRSIRDGYPDLGMPAFAGEMSEAEIRALAAYLISRRNTGNEPGRTIAEKVESSNSSKGLINTDAADFMVEAVAKVGPAFGFAFMPDGNVLITEVDGALRLVDPKGDGQPGTIHGTPAPGVSKEQYRRRLLDVSLHPDYRTNGWIYLLMAANDAPQAVADMSISLHRGRLRDGRWVDDQSLLTVRSELSSSARMAWDSQGFLYFASNYTGLYPSQKSDAPPEAKPPQDLASQFGKIFRVTDDGKAPPDNPFADRAGAYPYIWSYGHRSPLGLAFDRNGELWETENGARGGDEINRIQRGRNYGWPVITWGHLYTDALEMARPIAPAMEQPVVSFVPSPALGGLAVYTATAFPRWRDNLLVGSLKGRQLYRIVVDGDREVLRETLLHDFGRIRDIDTGPDGLVYLLTDDGTLSRLRPANAR